MTTTLVHTHILGNPKHIVAFYVGTDRVARIIFRETEGELAEQCYAAASAVDASDEFAVREFCDHWHATRAAAEDVRGGSGWGRDKYKPRQVWHTEGV